MDVFYDLFFVFVVCFEVDKCFFGCVDLWF